MVTMHRGPNWKISVYGREHGLPHFHIEGPGFRCSVGLATLEVLVGSVPANVQREALVWARKPGHVAGPMAGVEPMNTDRMRSIRSAKVIGGSRLMLEWSDGTTAELPAPSAASVELGDWGHSLVWPDGSEIGADSLWLDTLAANGRGDARQFLEWRLANGLSLAKAAEALGLARRTVAYYSNGDRPVPKTVLLACKGWESEKGLRKAA